MFWLKLLLKADLLIGLGDISANKLEDEMSNEPVNKTNDKQFIWSSKNTTQSSAEEYFDPNLY